MCFSISFTLTAQIKADSTTFINKIPDSYHQELNKSNIDSLKSNYHLKGNFDSSLVKAKISLNENFNFKKDSTIKDSLKNLVKEKINVKKKDFGIHGVLSNQFDYGTVPYYIPNAHTPTGLFKSQGDLKLSAKKIPFLFNYFYMNPANLLGIQNYYTLKFDYETYQENLRNEVAEKKAGYLSKLKEAEHLKQQYEQKLGYYEAINAQEPIKLNAPNIEDYKPAIDTSGFASKNPYKDSLSVPYSKIDTAGYKNAYKDSLNARLANDSNYKKIAEYKEKIEQYESQIKEYDQKIKLLNDPKQLSSIDNPYISKVKNFLGNIKRFEIGMCYPNYSTFLVNNLTLKGINTEYATSNYFVNLTYGKTINNLLGQPQTNNSIINSFQQSASFFDLSKNQDARKILTGKIGLGNKSTSYIAFGALYGVGKQNYFNTASGKETNLVYELDGKTTIKGYVLSASYAKSFINQAGTDQNTEPLSKTRNNALQLRFSGVIPFLKTKFNLGYRMVDPFFKSYGVGFIRTDNIRYEAKLEQAISSKFKVGVNYRRDEDNLLNRYGFKSSLNYISTSVKLKLFRKRLDINLIYTPIIQKIKNLTTKSVYINKSDMKNVVISYSPKFKKVVTTLTGMYSQYSIYDSLSIRNLENFNLGIVNVFRNSFKIGANSSFYNSNVNDSMSSSPKTILSSLEVGYSFKKIINTSLRVKHSYNLTNKTNQYGLGFNVDMPLNKFFSIELHAEKLIVGDFYNSLNISSIDRFPYYGYVKFNVKL
ncbi:MAG: hypothetical protein HY062_01580 [Bacteroidetes bacterium]|nr:hypothetical protein [Bacteroidota bacterium]